MTRKKAMQQSRRVSILGVPHTITRAPVMGAMGAINHQNLQILVDDSASVVQSHITLCHEIAHGMLALLGHDKACDDEALVQGIGLAVYRLIKDNPDIVRMIGEGEAI